MGFMLALVFIIMAATFYFDGTSGPIRDNQINGGILAQQLILQQAAASRACTDAVSCPEGTVIDAKPQLASYDAKTGASNFGNGDLVSFSTGARVVSYFKVAGSAAYQNQVYGSMGAWLAVNSPKSNIRYVGRYDSGSNTISTSGSVGYNVLNPDGSSTRVSCTLAAVPLPGNPGNIPSGAPVLATDMYSPAGAVANGVSVCS